MGAFSLDPVTVRETKKRCSKPSSWAALGCEIGEFQLLKLRGPQWSEASVSGIFASRPNCGHCGLSVWPCGRGQRADCCASWGGGGGSGGLVTLPVPWAVDLAASCLRSVSALLFPLCSVCTKWQLPVPGWICPVWFP